MRVIVAVLCLALVSFAGCSDSEEGEDPMDAVGVEPQYRDDETNFTVDQPTLPRTPPAPGERTLDEVPTWRLGEWWQYRMTSHFDGTTYDFLRVVAGTEHGNYLVGFPVDQFVNDVMVLHVPGYGDILRDDLSYAAHDVPYAPLNFPLEEGKTWTTHFEAENNVLTFVVEEVDEANGTAFMTASASGGQGGGQFTYDAALGEISRWISPGYADYEIVDHGYNYTGAVRVPHDHDLIFFHGRLAGAVDLASPLVPPNPVLPTETAPVEEGYDRASFAIILFDGIVSNGQSAGGASPGDLGLSRGYYSVRATAPDGTVYETTMMPGESPIKIVNYGHEGPAGDWDLEFVAGGEGIAFLEGIGYHSIDIEMPSGCVLASANADHHTQLCKA